MLGSFLFYKEGTLPVNKNDTTPKIFVIKQGENLNTIARDLSAQGLIRNRLVFYWIVKDRGYETKIQAGDFRLSPAMNANEIAETLTHGTLDNWVTFIEGMRKEEIAQIVSKNFNIPEVEFISVAPEGTLFPDTYLMPRDATTGAIISIMTNTFNQKYTPEMREKARKLGLSDQQVLILASIVEREANSTDRQQIASILLRRLREDIKLQADATVQYALGYQPDEKSWWKKNLSLDDLALNSLYNTYKVTGLPPGPISNPSISSIEAVVNADPNTPYLFYIHDPQGGTHYARNGDEHEANIKKYLQ